MKRDLGPYNVWLAFTERDTGNYVTGVKVSVIDSKENAVIDTVSDGPWLLAQVPPDSTRCARRTGRNRRSRRALARPR